METMNTLNTTDEWENIVNNNHMQRSLARERMAAKKRERKLKELWLTACGLATISITAVILGATGAVVGLLATFIAIGSLVYASILFGRYMEVKKVW